MTNKFVTLVALALLAPSAAAAAELNALSGLKVAKTAGGAQVVVAGSKAPTFTVFRLNDPDRLVVDLQGADAAAIAGLHNGAGPVDGVVASQFKDDKASVGRVLLALNGASKYDVRADGSRLIISVDADKQVAAPAAEPAPTEKTELAVAETAAAPAVVEPARPAAVDGVVASRVDEKPVQHPAQKLLGLSWKGDTLSVKTDGEVGKFEVIELADPPRLAIDLHGVTGKAKPPKTSGPVREVRVGAHSDKIRLVVDAAGEMPVYSASRTSSGVKLTFKPQVARAAVKAEDAETDGPAVVEIDGQPVALEAHTPVSTRVVAPSIVEVKEVGFEEAKSGGRVNIALTGETKWKVERPDASSAVLTLESARIAKRLERSLDTQDLDTPVKMVSAFAAPGAQDRVRVVVASDGALDETVVKTPQGLAWRLSVKGVKTEVAQTEAKSAGFTDEPLRVAEQGAPQKGYVGKKVSFEFKDIDIHNLLRIIAEISKKNIVVADDVRGRVTIRLRNVPWDQALELILRSKGLGKENLGNNIVRVAPLAVLEAEAKSRAERAKQTKALEELSVSLVPVNYATAGDMATRVKEVLTERGNVAVDGRTNTLIVRDVGSNMGKVRSMVQSLDTQTPQVLIESRIVEANTSFQREVGIQWGPQVGFSQATGNATGLAFPNTMFINGASGNAGTGGLVGTPQYAVNLPVGIGAGSGGGLGFTFGSAGGALQLHLRLSALENQGVVKTISAPKVTTLDNNTARISQGISIPFSQVSAGGVNTSFVEARLSLEVTPHITADGSVLMTIRAENNQPDPANTGANGQPAIQRKEANTQVLVKDAETTVIGGIYVRAAGSSSSGVPFFSKIPILGFFFRNSRELDSRSELLIFITPRILNRATVAQNP